VSIDPCPSDIVMFSARIPIALVLLAGCSQHAMGRLTQPGCFAHHCVQSFNNGAGGSSVRFYPDATDNGGLGDEVCSDPKLDRLVSIHARGVQRGEVPNIAYWNVLDKSVLGDSDWSVHEWQPGLEAGVIVLCLTGSRPDGTSTTMCYQAEDDDDFTTWGDDCNTRSSCGAMHGTRQPMTQTGRSVNWKFNRSSQTPQYVNLDIGAWRPNIPAVPAMPLVHGKGRAMPAAISLTAYVVDYSGCATSPPGAAHDVLKPDEPHCARS